MLIVNWMGLRPVEADETFVEQEKTSKDILLIKSQNRFVKIWVKKLILVNVNITYYNL